MMKTFISLVLLALVMSITVSVQAEHGGRRDRGWGNRSFHFSRGCRVDSGVRFSIAPIRYCWTPRVRVVVGSRYVSRPYYSTPIYAQSATTYVQPEPDYEEVEAQTAPPIVTYPSLSGPSEQGLINLRRERERHTAAMLAIENQRREKAFRNAPEPCESQAPEPVYVTPRRERPTPPPQPTPRCAHPPVATPPPAPPAAVAPTVVVTPVPAPAVPVQKTIVLDGKTYRLEELK